MSFLIQSILFYACLPVCTLTFLWKFPCRHSLKHPYTLTCPKSRNQGFRNVRESRITSSQPSEFWDDKCHHDFPLIFSSSKHPLLFSEMGFLCIALASLEIHDLPVSASRVLVLKACLSTLTLFNSALLSAMATIYTWLRNKLFISRRKKSFCQTIHLPPPPRRVLSFKYKL